jgi:polysaccharide export outer membrane protein
LGEHFKEPKVSVDIYGYNSKVYYVILEDENHRHDIHRFAVTGNETLWDAISEVSDESMLSAKNLWIARLSPSGADQILPVRLEEIAQGRGVATNYQILPGDRVYISRANAPAEGYTPPTPKP